ncbi:hypothetical protein OEZ85_012951 [Tetradesmus obliquus]|uniref:Vacuolar protein sorting-associated protein 54 N-terminal domain-containing protein n=1 Tax=Tetradesmus obliquus TaxID=3088 RepID=A0ABY8U4E8_TETOB|nr:hypothetical protein OEZ85_012951 [Tetradesmus obliquus]
MSNVLDDLTTRFKSFSDTLEQGLSSISDLPSMLSSRPKGSVLSGRQLHGGSAHDAPPATKSRKERDARAELILQQLPQAYFDQGFDPLEHELRQMGDETKQEDVDSVVERLSAAVEVVGVRLAKQVQKQQEKLIAGITNVTHVEDDLKAAHVICKGTRSQLRMAAEDVQRQIKIITTTCKKQAYMEVLEVANKMKKIQDLQQALRKVHEQGDFGEAILLCMDCFQAVDTLGAFTVEPELRLTVQQQYYDTQQRLGTALLNVCSDFTPQGYSKVSN